VRIELLYTKVRTLYRKIRF